MKRHILSLILAVLIVFTASACKSETANNSSDTVTESSSAVSDAQTDAVEFGVTSEIQSGESSKPANKPVSSVSQADTSSSDNLKPPVSSDSTSNNNSYKSPYKVNGISLSEYDIIYDSDDIYSKYAAEILERNIWFEYGCYLTVLADTSEETDYEILVGDTNRAASEVKSSLLSGDKYLVKTAGKKLVLQADGYMIGGAVRELLELCSLMPKSGNGFNLTISSNAAAKTYVYKTPENVLLYIGDGMGHNHINWASKESGFKFCAEDMPNIGELITYSYSVNPLHSAAYTDSAAAGTALATGFKTLNGVIGKDHNKKSVKNIRELAASKGAKTAVLTTDSITGATPAAFFAHCNDRGQTQIIQEQLNELFAENGITEAAGTLGDALLMNSINTLDSIGTGTGRFFMMLEEGHIDKYSHNNDKSGMIKSIKRFNDTIAYAMQFVLVRGDTVLIVTADHETGGIDSDGSNYKFTSGNHTNRNVPLFAMGKGTEVLTKKPLNNVLVPRFIAALFGETDFGDMSITE